MPTRFIAAVLLLACATPVPAAPKPDTRIPVYVRSAADADGFTDPSQARTDSLNDLVKQISESKIVAAVPAEQDALAILEVLTRGAARGQDLLVVTPFNGVQRQRSMVATLDVRVIVGDYSAAFGAWGGTYRRAAKEIVRQLDRWVIANRERLLAGESK